MVIESLASKTRESDDINEENSPNSEEIRAPNVYWMYLALSPSNPYRLIAERHTGRVPFVRKIISRTGRNREHPCAHWSADLKKNWRFQMSFLFKLVSILYSGEEQDTPELIEHHPCIEPNLAIMLVGADDKSSMSVGVQSPLEAVQRQSTNRAIVCADTIIETSDHSFGNQNKLIPSVIHFMNKSIEPGDSLYSGGVNGTGQTYVALHNSILNPSSGMKHAAHLLSFIAEKGGGRVPFPYLVLLECDGGPDHNLTFLINQISLVGVFLLGGMDKLNGLRGCAGRIYSNLYSYLKDVTNTLIFLLPGMSYLNTAERPMSNLNRGVTCLALQMDPNKEPFLEELLLGASSMKTTRKALIDYDNVLHIAIQTLKRRLHLVIANTEEESEPNDDSDLDSDAMSENDKYKYGRGHSFDNFFPFYGWFEGKIIKLDPNAASDRIYLVKYEDGYEEHMTEDEINKIAEENETIGIGEEGFQFVKKFGSGWYNGRVTKELPNGKLLCTFNDGDVHTYTPAQVEKFAKNQNKGKV